MSLQLKDYVLEILDYVFIFLDYVFEIPDAPLKKKSPLLAGWQRGGLLIDVKRQAD